MWNGKVASNGNSSRSNKDVPLDIKHSYKLQLFEEWTGCATGFALSPVDANLFVEHFAKDAIDSFSYKPK